MKVPLEQVMACLHLWFYLSAARFNDRHVTRNGMRVERHESPRDYRLWICLLYTSPSPRDRG
eukprot:2189606-Amphidinium_carterae.1